MLKLEPIKKTPLPYEIAVLPLITVPSESSHGDDRKGTAVSKGTAHCAGERDDSIVISWCVRMDVISCCIRK